MSEALGSGSSNVREAWLSVAPPLQPDAARVVLCVADELFDRLSLALTHVRTEAGCVRCSLNDLSDMTPAGLFVVEAGDISAALDPRLETLLRKSQDAYRVVVLFSAPEDPRRSQVSTLAGYEHIVSPDGNLSSLLALLERIWTRQNLESRLVAAMGQVRSLVEVSNDGVFILQGASLVYVNPRFEEMVQRPGPALLNQENILQQLVHKDAWALIEQRREEGNGLSPKFEIEFVRPDGSRFPGQVSASTIDLGGTPATLGFVQDITERKRFEEQLLRKNHELEILHELSASINQALELDEILRIGCRRVSTLLGYAAAGITLYTHDRSSLTLRVTDGLEPPMEEAIRQLDADEDSLLAFAVRQGEVQVVSNLRNDPRIRIERVRNAPFRGCTVVPLRAGERVLGGAFFFTRAGVAPSEADRELLLSIGTFLGTAIDKAALRDRERSTLARKRSLDELALLIASNLDAIEVVKAVAKSVYELFGPDRVMIARYVGVDRLFLPLCVAGEAGHEMEPIPAADTLMGTAHSQMQPLQQLAGRLRRHGNADENPVHAYEKRFFAGGFGNALSVPVISDGDAIASLHLLYRKEEPIPSDDLDALFTLAMHLAIGMKNAELLSARNDALEELRATQDSLVQAERLKALGEMAAGVAHDFNNLLGAILGRAQLLTRRLESADLRKHAEVIETAANDGASTVKRIQKLGKQSGKEDFVVVSLAEILDDVRELTMPRWFQRTREERRPIDLEMRCESELPLQVWGSPHELREVLINLVHNAVDAMPSGGKIHLQSRLVRDGDVPRAEVRVVDTGTGMPEEVKNRIFDPFFSTKGERGTGLGLSVSFSIIQKHEGGFRVESRTEGTERGTTFILDFPLHESSFSVDAASASPARATHTPSEEEWLTVGEPGGAEDTRITTPDDAPSTVQSSAEAAPTTESDLGPDCARILVIDDEENIREILSDILSADDHEVLTAESGTDGLALLAQHQFDLVFTDLTLPGMDGYEVASRVKEKDPSICVSLVTGWGATLDAAQVQERGIDMVLSKPFRFDQVMGLVEEALQRRRTLQG